MGKKLPWVTRINRNFTYGSSGFDDRTLFQKALLSVALFARQMNCFIQREGVFAGQCSELCGALHGYMPIMVEAVSPETYAAHAKKSAWIHGHTESVCSGGSTFSCCRDSTWRLNSIRRKENRVTEIAVPLCVHVYTFL